MRAIKAQVCLSAPTIGAVTPFVMLLERLRVPEPSVPHSSLEARVYFFRGLCLIGLRFPDRFRYLAYFYSFFMNFFITFCFPLLFMLSFKYRTTELKVTQFLQSLQVAINAVGGCIKVFIMAIQQSHLQKAEEHMRKLDARAVHPYERRKIQEMAASGNRIFVMFLILYWAFSLSTFVGAVVRGIPPYGLFYPYLNWRNNLFEFTVQCIVEFISINYIAFQECVLDAYAVIYINILRTHLQLLAERLKRSNIDFGGLNSNERYEELIKCILDHKTLLELFNEIGQVISGTIFTQFLFVGLIVGVALINVVLYADLSATIGELLFIIAALFETGPCCYYANCLMDDSDTLALAIFQSAWEDQDQRYRKTVAFFMQNTQRTMTLTAMKLLPISMTSNINVAKFAFSVFTLISTVDLTKRFNN